MARIRPLNLSHQLKEAFWKLCLNGNPAWTKYFSAQGQPRGSNSLQDTRGGITARGRDTRGEASFPYFYSVDRVEEYRLGFGFWSRTGDRDQAQYRFAAHDVEPMTPGTPPRVNRAPTSVDLDRTLCTARGLFKAWRKLARTRSEILWVLLVESSIGHYHVWALFERSLSKAEHDALLSEAKRLAGPLQDVDKDTSRATRGLGDQFRAPWTWKRAFRSEAIASWVRDETRAIELGNRATPRKPLRTTQLRGTFDPQVLWQEMRTRFPIVAPGQRNSLQTRMIGSLAGRGYSDEQILLMADRWLEYYEDCLGTPLEEAHFLAEECLRRTRANPDFRPASGRDYRTLHREAVLTPRQRSFLDGRLARDGNLAIPDVAMKPTIPPFAPSRQQNSDCDLLHVHVESHTRCLQDKESETIETHLAYFKDDDQDSPSLRCPELLTGRPLCESDAERAFVEALLLHVQCKIEETVGLEVKLTHEQLNEIIEVRRGLPLHRQQLQRVKERYVTFGRLGPKSLVHQARRFELLREVIKGRPGQPSCYLITGLGSGLDLPESLSAVWIKQRPAISKTAASRRRRSKRRWYGVYGGEHLSEFFR